MSEQIDNEPVAESPRLEYLSVGGALRAAREAKGLQVADVAQTLKLGVRQVEALECDAWSALPGNTFIRGIVRNYARHVDLDPAPLMVALEALLEKPVDTLGVPDMPATPMRVAGDSRDGLVVAVGAGILVLAAVAYFLLPGDLGEVLGRAQSLLASQDARGSAPAAVAETPPAREALYPPGEAANQVISPQLPVVSGADVEAVAAPSAPLEAAGAAATPVSPADGAAAGVPAQAGGVPLRFVVSRESWVEVRDRDGQVLLSQRLTPGSEQNVSGKGPLTLVIGYAPGVQLSLRGKPVDLAPHSRSDVARLVLE